MRQTFMCLGCLVLCTSAVAQDTTAPEPKVPAFDRAKLFQAPTPVTDKEGQVLLTKRAVGHPAVCDWNRDGKPDILLGCHRNMNTPQAEILMLQNVGTKEKPAFTWPAVGSVSLGAKPFATSCGCKSGGAFEVHPVDWNGDGFQDMVVNTHWSEGVVCFLNGGKTEGLPTYTKEKKLFNVRGHGKNSGGGDWNNDGIQDFVFPMNSYGWQVYLGKRTPAGGTQLADAPALKSSSFKMQGHEAYGTVGRKKQATWFWHSPYAWNFSGQSGKGKKTVEIVALMPAPGYRQAPYPQKKCHVNYYWLDLDAKTCTFKGMLAETVGAESRCAIGDLNADGSMDVLWTGGVFSRGEETKIWVMYGKVKNTKAPEAAKK